MNINPTQQTSNLHTDLTFEVIDMRGTKGFPKGQKGLVFSHKDQRVLKCRVTGIDLPQNSTFVVRTDDTGKGWRIDRAEGFGMFVAVYGPNRESYFPTNDAAAAALETHLAEVARKATVN